MKKVRQSYIRRGILGLLLAFVLFASISSELGEWYALKLYPSISKFLSALSSLVPFSLDEWVVVGLGGLLIGYPFYARIRSKKSWLSVLGHEVELLLWIYVWFYWGWGMNYYRASFFQRAEVKPAVYDDTRFHDFLALYTDSLNATFRTCWNDGYFRSTDILLPLNRVKVDDVEEPCSSRSDTLSAATIDDSRFSGGYGYLTESENEDGKCTRAMRSGFLCSSGEENETGLSTFDIREHIKEIYKRVPSKYGLSLPWSFQHPKHSSFNSLYSNVGVIGFMGPFFAESHVNHELNLLEYPFTYAHELSHLLGVSSEAEANLWAYTICTESENSFIRFCGYFGLFSYVWSNTRALLPSSEFDRWEASVQSEVMEAFYHRRAYWSMRYNETLGAMQSALYTFYLKRNRIASGQKNYSQVIGLLLSFPEFRVTWK